MPPISGAGFGKSALLEIPNLDGIRIVVIEALAARQVDRIEAMQWAQKLIDTPTSTDVKHEGTGLTFRISPEDSAPNVCPCCGRLVLPSDHAFGDQPDAYCLGCFTWGRDAIPCDPQYTAHPQQWKVSTSDAVWSLCVIFEPEHGQTDSDYRYCSDEELLHDDPVEAAQIAWPGMDPDVIISAEIIKIGEENEED
jgi:hypothetical protein